METIKDAIAAARAAVVAKCDDEMVMLRAPHLRALLAEIARLETEWAYVRSAANRAVGAWPPTFDNRP